MTKRLFFAAIALLIFALPALAKHVDVETAKTVARTFWTQNVGKQTRATFSDVTSQTEFTNFYIFNADGGFVIVSADNIAHPILGYSYEGDFDPQNIPVNTRGWLLGYENEIGWGISNGVSASEEITAEWEKLSNGQGLTPKRSRSVNALIQTKWNQNWPYNNLCPYNNNEEAHAVTGCVATAMAQVMKYWNYPESGIGSNSFTSSVWGTLSADFENTTYDWDNMLNEYDISSTTQEQQDAVATLMYHCGVSVYMSYGLTESGAYQYRVCESLVNYFKYKPSLERIGRPSYQYSDTAYKNILRNELDNGRPMMYEGCPATIPGQTSSGSGHSFVCDGYDNDDNFHFNWGWGGSCDGFYALNGLAPGSGGIGSGSGNYNRNQMAIIGIEPNTGLFAIPNVLSFSGLGESKTIYVRSSTSSDQQWSATSDQQWLTISPSTGEGSGAITTITATASRNYTDSERTATITITQENETATVTVVQPSGLPNAIGCFGTDDIEPISNYEIPVVLEDQAYWNIGSGEMAIICSESFGTGYYTSGQQVTTVSFTTLDGELTYWHPDWTNNSFTIKIFEGGNIEESLYNETRYGTMGTEVYSQDYTQSYYGEQEVTLDTPYTIDENTNFWIAIVANGKSLIRAKYIEYGEPYTLGESRDPFDGKYLYSDMNVLYPLEDWEYADEDSTTLQAYSVDLAMSFCVVDPELLVVTPETLYFNPEGGDVNFTVKSNNNVADEWTAVSDAEWLSLSTTSGEGGGTSTIVTATADEYISRTGRTATITITQGSETKVITAVTRQIPQNKFYLILSVNDSTLGYVPDLNGLYTTPPNIVATPYNHARFLKWNVTSDDPIITKEAVFAPVHNGDTLIYDNGSPSDWFVKSAPYDTTTYYRWGVKYDPSALGGVTQIPQVEMRLGPDGSEACNYTIQLWQGGDDSPQTLIHTQTSSIRSYYEWRVISFDTPVAIDSTLTLWVTISCTRSLHSSPLTAYDNCGNPNSNYIWIPETGWTHIDDCSWAIRAYTAVPTGRIVTTYVDYWDNHDTEARDCYVTGGGTYEVGSSVTLTAVPDSSHCFKSWSGEYSDYPHDYPHGEIQDVHENPVTFTVNRNVTYYALFSDEADLYVYSSNYSYGTAHVEGYTYSPTLAVGSTTTITAVPATSHIGFNHWEWHYTNNPSVVYQVTENPYTFRVTGDAEYTAFFNVLPVNITAVSNNYDYGNVTGGGIYNYGQYVSLTASPLAGYGFDHWEWYTNADPTNVHQSTDNPVNFYAEEDATYTAIFVPTIHITTLVNNPLWGNVTPSGDYVQGRTVTLTAEPYGNTVNFIYWEWYYDDNPSNVYQNTSNPLSFIALGDATYKAYFDGSISISHVTVRANNDAWGHVSGSGDYQSNESVMLRAEPYDGYRFLHWVWEEYGMTLEGNPFNFALYPGADSEITFTGYFESLTGVDETNTDDIRIYSLDGCIIVEGADGETVTIYDMTGRIVRDCGLPNGVYMVKVGERAPRKVVVAK